MSGCIGLTCSHHHSIFKLHVDLCKDYKGRKSVDSNASIDIKSMQRSPSTGLKHSFSNPMTSFNDNQFSNRLNAKQSTSTCSTEFSLADLETATANFARGHLLGEGSIGRVYRAKYPDDRNGSLPEFLHMSDDFSKPLTWNTRIRIALGTAWAIEYLHEVCSPSVIHKNIKSSNILLDAELNPCLTDYGLSNFHRRTSQNLGVGYNAP